MRPRLADFVLGLGLGALLGAVLALLFAPVEGTKMRQLLLAQSRTLRQQGEGALDQLSTQMKERTQEALETGRQTTDKLAARLPRLGKRAPPEQQE